MFVSFTLGFNRFSSLKKSVHISSGDQLVESIEQYKMSPSITSAWSNCWPWNARMTNRTKNLTLFFSSVSLSFQSDTNKKNQNENVIKKSKYVASYQPTVQQPVKRFKYNTLWSSNEYRPFAAVVFIDTFFIVITKKVYN